MDQTAETGDRTTEAIELRNRTGSAGGREGSSGRSLSAAGTELSKAPGQLEVHTRSHGTGHGHPGVLCVGPGEDFRSLLG